MLLICRRPISTYTTSSSESDNEAALHGKSKHNFVIGRVQPPSNQMNQLPAMQKHEDKTARLQMSIMLEEEGNGYKISLMKATNLKRSSQSANSRKFNSQGVYARIYLSKTDDAESDIAINLEAEYKQSSLVKTRKSNIIKFKQSESIIVKREQFPIRISLYECDRHNVRLSLGHCYVQMPEEKIFSNRIVTKELFPTVYASQKNMS